MKVELLQNKAGFNHWDLIVNDKLQVRDESFGVVDAIRDCLLGMPRPFFSEIEEVADSIRRGLKKPLI